MTLPYYISDSYLNLPSAFHEPTWASTSKLLAAHTSISAWLPALFQSRICSSLPSHAYNVEHLQPLSMSEGCNREEQQIASLLYSTVRLLTTTLLAQIAKVTGVFTTARADLNVAKVGGGAGWTV